MCIQVNFKDAEGMWDAVNCVGDLRKHCPQIVFDEHYDDITENQCLCCVDVEATAAANGFTWEVVWCKDYELTKIHEQE